MQPQTQSKQPVTGRWFKDRLGRFFVVLTIYWDKVLISYRNGDVKVVDVQSWDELVLGPHQRAG